MGADVEGFCAILRDGGHSVAIENIPVKAPRVPDGELSPQAVAEVMALYKNLGGKVKDPSLRPGSWDIQVDDVLVELDEELHFNRYRLVTLQASSYERLPLFPASTYSGFCESKEPECLKCGRGQQRWMNSSTETHFGPSGKRGDLSDHGSSRWKQRAVYDFMKDLTQLNSNGPRMARIAIWDELPGLAGVTVKEVIHAAPESRALEGLRSLITARSGVDLSQPRAEK